MRNAISTTQSLGGEVPHKHLYNARVVEVRPNLQLLRDMQSKLSGVAPGGTHPPLSSYSGVVRRIDAVQQRGSPLS